MRQIGRTDPIVPIHIRRIDGISREGHTKHSVAALLNNEVISPLLPVFQRDNVFYATIPAISSSNSCYDNQTFIYWTNDQ